MGLAHRMLDLMDREVTDLAPTTYEEPIEAYTSPELLAREREVLFARTPMFLAMSCELPEPGSYLTRDIVDSPLLMVRGRDGQVRMFLNVCRHRGVKVVDGEGTARRLTCPFHSWTYDLEGQLVGLPEPEGFEGVCREDRGLVELPVAEKYGMIFGCATPGVTVDPDEILGGLGPELAEWDFGSFTRFGEPHVHPVRGSWKFAWDTYCENYHFAFLHSKTLVDMLVGKRQAFDVFGRNVRMVSAMRSIDDVRGVPEDEWEPESHLSLQYRLFPSINFSVYPTKNEVYWLLPGRHPWEGQALHATYISQEPETDEEMKALQEAVRFGCEDVIDAEDLWVTARSEPGLHAPAAPRSLLFGRNEPAVQHFHRLYREAVLDYPT